MGLRFKLAPLSRGRHWLWFSVPAPRSPPARSPPRLGHLWGTAAGEDRCPPSTPQAQFQNRQVQKRSVVLLSQAPPQGAIAAMVLPPAIDLLPHLHRHTAGAQV
ncbi:MAG: hypothetical protein VKJ09_14160 [Leptolyngbya sp.]|nr:hypothetical protein [Leptolyngbya sp.]